MQIEEKIADMVNPVLDSLEFALVRVRFANATLQIMAEPRDETRQMTVDDCADISRRISAVLDVEDPIREHFTLEVSSPGLARPLTGKDDFIRFAGMRAKIALKEAVDGQRRFRGRITGVDDDDMVCIETDNGDGEDEAIAIALDAIAEARLDPSELFDKSSNTSTSTSSGQKG